MMTEKYSSQHHFIFDRLLHVSFATLCFLTPFVIWPGTYTVVKMVQLAFIQVGAISLALAWLAGCKLKQQCRIFWPPLLLPITAFCLWVLISLAYSANPFEAIVSWSNWTSAALLFFLTVQICDSQEKIDSIFIALVLAAFLTALLGIGQHLFTIDLVPQFAPPAATFVNRNMAGHFIVLTLPLCLFLLLTNSRKRRNFFYYIAATAMVLFLVYTGNRSAWLAMTIELVMFFLLARRFSGRKFSETFFWTRGRTITAAISLVTLLVLINTGPNGVQWNMGKIVDRALSTTRTGDNGQQSSVGLRLAFWSNSTAMIRDHFLFGVGAGNFRIIYPLYSHEIVDDPITGDRTQLYRLHNDPLQMFAELGLIGFLILCWAAFAAVRMCRRLLKKSLSRAAKLRIIAAISAMSGLLVCSLFSFPFQRPIPPFVFMVLLGTIAAFDCRQQPQNRTVWQNEKTKTYALTVALLVLVLACRYHYNSIRYDRLSYLMALSEINNRWDNLINQGRKAFQEHPGQVSYLSQVGKAFIEKGLFTEAVQVLRESVKYYPYSINDNLNLGLAATSIGQYNLAHDSYQRVVEIKPDFAKGYFNLGILYEKQNQLDPAIEALERAVTLEPDNIIMHITAGKVRAKRHNYIEAANHFEKALLLAPDSAMIHKNLGIIYQRLNHPE